MIKLSTSNASQIDNGAHLTKPEVHHAVANRQPHSFKARLIDPDLSARIPLLAYASAEQKYGWHHASHVYAEAMLGSKGISPALHLDDRARHIHCIGGVRHG